jgi:tetratricopeptide (TPR) repeat protein
MSAARHAGATELLDGALFDLGEGRIRLDLRRIDVATGAVLGAWSVQGTDPFLLADSASRQLVEDLDILAPAGPIADLTTRSLAAYQAYDAGLRQYFGRRFAAAESHFGDAVRADSGFAMAWYYWALASWDEALRLSRLDQALQRAPRASDRERLLISAQWALHNAAPNALALAETLAVRYPAEVDGHLLLGHALYGREEFPAGLRSFARVVVLDSVGLRGDGVRCAACEGYASLVAGYATMDSLSAALREGRAWAAAQPRNPEPWRQMAMLAGQFGDTATAEASLRRAEAIDTNSALRQTYRIAVLTLAERYRDAELADSARLAAGMVGEQLIDALWSQMLVSAQQGRYEKSLAAATRMRREVAALGPVEREGHPLAITVGLGEAQALRQTGRLRQSIARFDSLAGAVLAGSSPTRVASNRAWILAHQAGVLAEAGDTVRLAQVLAAIDSLSAVSGAWLDRMRVRYVTGLMQEARGSDREAYTHFVASTSKAIDGFGMPAIHRAGLATRLGRPREAVGLMQRLLRSQYHFYVTHPELHLALAEAWAASGNRDSAAAHLAAVGRAWNRADPPVRARLEQARNRLGFH